MSVPRRSSDFESYSAYDADVFDEFAENEFALSPGERIGGQVSRANDAIAWCLSVAMILGGGWAMIHDDGALLARIPELATRASSAIGAIARLAESSQPPVSAPSSSAPIEHPAPQAALPQPPPLPVATAVAEPPPVKSEPVEEAAATDDVHATQAGARKDDAARSRDPFQKQAEAAGLNPDLSRAVLMRFTKRDFKNARFAIETAIAKTPDDEVFVWPRQRKPGDALFKVHFVEGAGPDCRRYVVSVTVSNWTTTAQPMERCGVPRVASRASAELREKKRAAP